MKHIVQQHEKRIRKKQIPEYAKEVDKNQEHVRKMKFLVFSKKNYNNT